MGCKADAWEYKDLRRYAKKKFGTATSYPAAVRRFYETDVVFRAPCPRHPDAASEEERGGHPRDASKEIPSTPGAPVKVF